MCFWVVMSLLASKFGNFFLFGTVALCFGSFGLASSLVMLGFGW